MRVLHVIDDAASGGGGFRCVGLNDPVLRAAAMVAGRGHAVLLVGDARLERDAAAAGLTVAERIGRGPGWAWTGVPALRRLVAEVRPGVVVAWSVNTLVAVRRAGRDLPVHAVLLDGPPAGEGPARAAAAHAAGAARVVCGPAAARAWIAAGVPESLVTVAPPPVGARPADPGARRALRRRLGLHDETPAVLVLGRSPHADAVRFVFLHGLLSLAGRRFSAIMPSGVSQFDRGQRYFRSSSVNRDVVVTPWGWPRLLAAADLAVFDGGGSGPTHAHPPCPAAAALPIAWAHAAGVPVVAPGWADTDGLYPSEARACLAHNAVLPELARVLTPLVTEPGLARSLGEACRRHVARSRPADGFVEAVESLWSAAAGRPRANDAVEVPA